MKCQKCGAEMVSGHLYCDICGAEYQIVPDFEPEIEDSIAQSMSNITETLDSKTTDEDLNIVDTEQNYFKVPAFSTIFFLVLVIFILLYAGYHKYTHSVDYQNAQAIEAINNQNYYKAAQIYKKLRKDNSHDAYWYIQEANAKLMLNKSEEAYNLAVLATELTENADMAYDFLLSYLENQGNYIEMNQILENCEFEEIKEKYWEHLCIIPKISHESGKYDTSLEIVFEDGYQGSIYYTLDKTIPNIDSLKYQEPVILGNGTHILTVIYENAFGIFSEPVVYEYHITSAIPLPPDVIPDSGAYTLAEMITLNIEEGTSVYYTTDSTQPTKNSTEYTVPIPMPLGKSQFNFIAYSSEGIASKVTKREFTLDIKINISKEDASIFLMQELITAGHILNFNGSVKDRYGVFQYFYKYTISDEGKNYYVYEEHYLENQINNPLNHFYAVDVLTGNAYKLILDGLGNFTRVEI